MLKCRSSFVGFSFLLCAALSLSPACEAGTNEAGGDNSTRRPRAETQANSSAVAGEAEEAAVFPAMTILDDYQSDPSAADRKYKGRTLIVTGVVAETGKSKAGVPFISFQRPGVKSPAGALVVCSLTLDQEAAVQALEKGREVKLSGRVQGTLTGNVLLENCMIQH